MVKTKIIVKSLKLRIVIPKKNYPTRHKASSRPQQHYINCIEPSRLSTLKIFTIHLPMQQRKLYLCPKLHQ